MNYSEWIEALGRMAQYYGNGTLANKLQLFIIKGKEKLDNEIEE